MLLKNKRAIITGASRGIGRAIALEYARQGADIIIGHYDDGLHGDKLISLIAEIEFLGRRAVEFKGNIGDPKTGEALTQKAIDCFGGVDIFVNNAGICPFHSFLDVTQDIYYRTIDINLNGAYFAVQAAAKQMAKQQTGGTIIAVSSISALVGGGEQTHYTPTKAGLLSLMNSCAIALAPHGIRCNSLLPGTIETDINNEDLSDDEKRIRMVKRIPLGRLGKPEDLAGPAVFLASEMAQYVTGAALLVDGGAFVNLQ